MWIRTVMASGGIWSHVAINLNCVVCTRERAWELRGSCLPLTSLSNRKAPWGVKKASRLGWSPGKKRLYLPEGHTVLFVIRKVCQSREWPLRSSHCLLGPFWASTGAWTGAGRSGSDVGAGLRNVALQPSPNLSRQLPFPLGKLQLVLPGLHPPLAGRAGSGWWVQ